MRMRSRRRHAGRRLLNVGAGGVGGLGADAAHTILTITDGGVAGEVLVTTAAPHGLTGVENVVVSGSSVAGYNGLFSLSSSATPTTVTMLVAYTADATGGTWALA